MKPSRRRRLAAADDSGSVLVVSLVITTVVAVVVSALLSYADSNVRATVALRSQATAAATADGAAQAALDELRTNTYNNDLSSAVHDRCFGATDPSATSEGDSVLTLPDFLPGSTGAAANSAAVRCTPDPSTGASGDSVPITSANKPGNAIHTVGTDPAEIGFEVKALNTSLPFNVHGGIVSNSNIVVTDGSLKSTVDVWAHTGCTGTIVSTPPPVCDHATVPTPDYTPEATAVPIARTVPTSCPGGLATFEAGYYTNAKALSDFMGPSSGCKNSVWWFKPGVYYFDFQNTAGTHEWNIGTGHLLAGTPVDSAGDPLLPVGTPPTATPAVPGGCDNPIRSTTAVGVQFVFGGDSRMKVSGTANAEICGSYHTDRPPVAVYGVRTNGTGTSGGGTGKAPDTVDAGGWTSTTDSTAVQAVATVGDGESITWSGSGGNSTNVTASGFTPTFDVPAGSTLTSAKLRITYVAGATETTAVRTRNIAVTPTPGTVVNKSLSAAAPTTAAPYIETDLTTDLATAVRNNGLTALQLGYTVTKTGGSTVKEVIDGIQLDLTWTGPAMRAQSGCITAVYTTSAGGCPVISTDPSYSGKFYIQGTTYVPLAPVDISLSNITAQVLRFGVISRVLRVKETGALTYSGPVIEIPDDSPGYGPGGTVVLLESYVCQAAATCEPPGGPDDPAVPDGRLGLRVRGYIKDTGAIGPAGGREVVVQSWAVQR